MKHSQKGKSLKYKKCILKVCWEYFEDNVIKIWHFSLEKSFSLLKIETRNLENCSKTRIGSPVVTRLVCDQVTTGDTWLSFKFRFCPTLTSGFFDMRAVEPESKLSQGQGWRGVSFVWPLYQLFTGDSVWNINIYIYTLNRVKWWWQWGGRCRKWLWDRGGGKWGIGWNLTVVVVSH